MPSIAPAHGSFPELITDGVDGVLFPPGDVARSCQLVRGRRERTRPSGRHSGDDARRPTRGGSSPRRTSSSSRRSTGSRSSIRFGSSSMRGARGLGQVRLSEHGGEDAVAESSDLRGLRGVASRPDRARVEHCGASTGQSPARPGARTSSTQTECRSPTSPDSGRPTPAATR